MNWRRITGAGCLAVVFWFIGFSLSLAGGLSDGEAVLVGVLSCVLVALVIIGALLLADESLTDWMKP
jgi:hypothetical protein